MTKETGTDCDQDTQEQAHRADPLPPDRTDRGIDSGLVVILVIFAFVFGILFVLLSPYIIDRGLMNAVPHFEIPSPYTIVWAMGHDCVYNCTMYWPDRCLDHGYHYVNGSNRWGDGTVSPPPYDWYPGKYKGDRL
jgi:hypothetical protein